MFVSLNNYLGKNKTKMLMGNFLGNRERMSVKNLVDQLIEEFTSILKESKWILFRNMSYKNYKRYSK